MDFNLVFFITGLPRSRTAWFSEFMTFGNIFCHHELLKTLQHKDEFNEGMELDYRHVGNSDCGLFITNFQERFPDAKTVIIHRDINDVYESLKVKGNRLPTEILQMMEDINRNIKGLHVNFDDINDRLEEIFTYCTGERLPKERLKYINENIQVDITGDPESLLLWS